MAVAVRNTPETSSSPKLFDHLAVSILAGVVYVLGGVFTVFYGLPSLWWNILGLAHGFASEVVVAGASAVTAALLLLLMLVAGTGLIFVGIRLLSTHAKPGLRAGIFFGLVGVLVAAEVASTVGTVLEHQQISGTAGIAASAAVGLLLVAGLFVAFGLRGCERWLATVEEQGWFSGASYKRSQGLRVRRGTMLGILVLAACGIYTLLSHQLLQTGPATWAIPVPFTDGVTIPLLPHVSITLPLALAAASLWLAYRVVNYPTFADFLIATEAEMNKVSWTTRKRLVQDTVVVLVTVALLTFFLFVVDQLWAVVLTRVGVLQVPQNPTGTAAQKEPSY